MKKEERKQLIKLMRRYVRIDIICRFWPLEKIRRKFPRSDLHRLRVDVYDDIMKALYGTDDMVEIGMKTGLLKEDPKEANKKRIKKQAKKNIKEIKEFFGGKSEKNKKGLSKKRHRRKDASKVSKKKKPEKTS